MTVTFFDLKGFARLQKFDQLQVQLQPFHPITNRFAIFIAVVQGVANLSLDSGAFSFV